MLRADDDIIGDLPSGGLVGLVLEVACDAMDGEDALLHGGHVVVLEVDDPERRIFAF